MALGEGSFVATYKYALLMALADIAVELGREDDSPLLIDTRLIAERFVQYYWRQSAPYMAGAGGVADTVLRPNTNKIQLRPGVAFLPAKVLRPRGVSGEKRVDALPAALGAKLIELRFFAGLSNVDAAKALDLAERTAQPAIPQLFQNLEGNSGAIIAARRSRQKPCCFFDDTHLNSARLQADPSSIVPRQS